MTGGLAARVVVRQGAFALDVDLALPPGQVVAVVGPNGAGKSTLLRALAGLVPLAAGRVELAGRLLADERDRAAPAAVRPARSAWCSRTTGSSRT